MCVRDTSGGLPLWATGASFCLARKTRRLHSLSGSVTPGPIRSQVQIFPNWLHARTLPRT
ncbi:hypothetical protein E2C01_006665 [Portunus trituberculatus]|uniref:Uncharacterized protein n=1 Tax=Portunus trituberculatus TaxID=210409 RepID=A0A5B7D0A0_PORTR|nr:hypothetical protein [Portunus trituberculatus]